MVNFWVLCKSIGNRNRINTRSSTGNTVPEKKHAIQLTKKNSSIPRAWFWRHVVIWWTPNRKTLRSRFWLSQRLNFELQNRFHNRARSGLDFEGHVHFETRSVHPPQRWRARLTMHCMQPPNLYEVLIPASDVHLGQQHTAACPKGLDLSKYPKAPSVSPGGQ